MGGVTDRYTPEGRRFMKELEELAKLEVRVGYQHGKKKHKPSSPEGKEVDMCDIAAWNELGTETIPSRPFLRDSVDKRKSELSAVKQRQFKRLVNGETAKAVLKEIGEYQVRAVRKEITDGDFVPNAESTIRKKSKRGKRGDHPLIDTGQMRASVHYWIAKKGSE